MMRGRKHNDFKVISVNSYTQDQKTSSVDYILDRYILYLKIIFRICVWNYKSKYDTVVLRMELKRTFVSQIAYNYFPEFAIPFQT